MMKVCRIATLALASALCGCVNLFVRTEGVTEVWGRRTGTPYLCAPYPFACTGVVCREWLTAPFRLGRGTDPIGDALATLTWPLSLVDLPCEVALDTVFLPVDAAYWLLAREDGQ